jgi:hypothetical protein
MSFESTSHLIIPIYVMSIAATAQVTKHTMTLGSKLPPAVCCFCPLWNNFRMADGS